jgi:hypothetical protein
VRPRDVPSMWLDEDDPLDPDSAEGCLRMMQALEEAESGHASAAVLSQTVAARTSSSAQSGTGTGTSTSTSANATSSSLVSLRCSVPWGAMLHRDANPDTPLPSQSQAGWNLLVDTSKLEVVVNWGRHSHGSGGGDPPAARLAVRHRGVEIAAVEGVFSEPLALRFDVSGAPPGEAFVAELAWGGGVAGGDANLRTLHILPPLSAPLRLAGLLTPPAPRDALPDMRELLAPWDAQGGSESHRAPLACLPSRALGLELEVLTFAPNPEASGCFTKAEELRQLLERTARKAGGGGEDRSGGDVGDSNTDADGTCTCEASHASRLRSLLARCQLWSHEVDDHVMFASPAIAARTVGQCCGQEAAVGGIARSGGDSDGQQQLECLLAGGGGTMKSEFKSPSPDVGALRFDRGAAEELACILRILQHMGAGAPALSVTANGGGSLHVHVNVLNEKAGGDVYSWKELLAVFVAWVRYDGVIARFARPWMWREPSMAPLYASGSEFSWHEKAWDQGATAAAGGTDTMYDVPHFVRELRRVVTADGFEALDEAEKIERIFGRGDATPATRLGRYCSMNLRRLTSYGTLEVRRFHSSLDEGLVVRWAHFCVAFVECFRTDGGARRLLLDTQVPLEAALAALRAEQEQASPDDLMAAMQGHVHPSTASIFMRDSGAEPFPL